MPPSLLTAHNARAAALYGAGMCLNFLAMLLVMTFDVALFIAVVSGAACGQFLLLSDVPTALE